MDFKSWMQIGVHAHQRFPWAQSDISECLSFWLDKSLCTLIDCQNCCYVIFRQLVNHQIISSLCWHPCGSQRHEWRAIYLCVVFWLMDRNHHQKFPCIKNYKCKSGFVRVTYKHSLQCRHVLSIHDWSSFCFKDASLFLQGAYTCEEHDCYIPPLLHGPVWLRMWSVCCIHNNNRHTKIHSLPYQVMVYLCVHAKRGKTLIK